MTLNKEWDILHDVELRLVTSPVVRGNCCWMTFCTESNLGIQRVYSALNPFSLRSSWLTRCLTGGARRACGSRTLLQSGGVPTIGITAFRGFINVYS